MKIENRRESINYLLRCICKGLKVGQWSNVMVDTRYTWVNELEFIMYIWGAICPSRTSLCNGMITRRQRIISIQTNWASLWNVAIVLGAPTSFTRLLHFVSITPTFFTCIESRLWIFICIWYIIRWMFPNTLV